MVLEYSIKNSKFNKLRKEGKTFFEIKFDKNHKFEEDTRKAISKCYKRYG